MLFSENFCKKPVKDKSAPINATTDLIDKKGLYTFSKAYIFKFVPLLNSFS